MRKILSFVLAVTVVFSCVAFFSSCDKEPTKVDVSTMVSDTDTLTGTTENITENAFDLAVTAGQWYDEQYIESGIEHTTNSNYQKDYDELTLPPAITSINKNDTTVNAPQFTTPSTNTTTKKETTTKTSSNKETTKTTTTTTTTTSSDSDNGSGGYVTPSEVPRPNVTYFDKYVKSVLNSGNYTATVAGTFQGHSATVNIYKNGGTAYNISTVYHSVPVSCRYFYSGGNVYIIVPSMISYAVVDVADPVVGVLESMVSSESVAMTADGMTYCGVTSGTGYVCESYKDSDGTTYNYYFNEGGLTKIGVSGPSGNSTISVSLRSGVSAGGVFSVPSGYKKVDVQVFIDKVESLEN